METVHAQTWREWYDSQDDLTDMHLVTARGTIAVIHQLGEVMHATTQAGWDHLMDQPVHWNSPEGTSRFVDEELIYERFWKELPDAPETRRDVTNNTASDFDDLAEQLRADGFPVDHFHAIELMDGTEYVTHFNQDNYGHFVPDMDGISDDPHGWYRVVADAWHE